MESKQASQVTWGLVVIAVGLVLLAGQTETGWRLNFGRLWPVVFFLIGVGKFLAGNVRSGVWFFCLGGIFVMHTFRIMTLNNSWPLFIVLGGISMLLPKPECGPKAGPTPPPGDRSGEPRLTDGGFQS